MKGACTAALIMSVSGCAHEPAVAPLLDVHKEVAVRPYSTAATPVTLYAVDRSHPSPALGTRELTVRRTAPGHTGGSDPLSNALATKAEWAALPVLIVIVPVFIVAVVIRQAIREEERKKLDANQAVLVEESVNVTLLNDTFVARFRSALGWTRPVDSLSAAEGIDLQISKIYLGPYEWQSQKLVVCGRALFFSYGSRPSREFETCTEEILHGNDQFAREEDIDRFRARVLGATAKLAESMATDLTRIDQPQPAKSQRLSR